MSSAGTIHKSCNRLCDWSATGRWRQSCWECTVAIALKCPTYNSNFYFFQETPKATAAEE